MKKLTPSALNKFKGSVDRALFENLNQEFTSQIPDSVYANLFENFGNDHKVAWDVMNSASSNQIDYSDLDKHLNEIPNVDIAADILVDNIKNNKKTLFITDSDNDGSFAQSGLLEFCNKVDSDNIYIEYSQALSKTTHHGFTKELVINWFDANDLDYDTPVDIVTADNGINSVMEQTAILEQFPNVNLIITDHHLPDEKNRVIMNDRTTVVNPKVGENYGDLSEYWNNKNISGAHTLMLILEKASAQILSPEDQAESSLVYKRLSHISNLIDYVDSDIRHKPTSLPIAERNATLSGLMNSNNTMRKIINNNISKVDLESSSLIQHKEFLLKINNVVKDVNFRAKSILSIIDNPGGESFNLDFLNEINAPRSMSNINQNYIEQLRPHIFYLSEKDNKTLYEASLLTSMLEVYKDLKQAEKDVMEYMRERESGVSIMKSDFSTVMYPNSELHELILNRKLLMKTYNEENNGLMMVIDRLNVDTNNPEVAGSFRSLESIYDILTPEDIAKFEEENNLTIEIQGHAKAAGIGFKFNSKSSTMKIKKTLNLFSELVSNKYSKLPEPDNAQPLITTDLMGLKHFSNLNKVTRGYLSNMNDLSPVLMLSPDDNIQNPTTQEIMPISEFIKKKQYGYAVVPTTVDGHTAILPVNLLHKVVNSDYKVGIEMSAMSSDAFIGSSTKSEDELKNALSMNLTDNTLERDMEFYTENHQNNNDWVDISLEDITLNDTDIIGLENTMIEAVDVLGASISSIDFEAQLGGSPKAFNVGVTNIDIDKSSQKSLSVNNFNNRAIVSSSGDTFLLSKQQKQELGKGASDILTTISPELVSNFKNHFTNINGDVFVLKDGSTSDDLLKINNKKTVDDRVVYNRSIKVRMFNKIIKDKDVKIPTNLNDLTGISQSMVDTYGENTYIVDRAITSLLKNENTILTAWNLPFDMRVIKTNFPMMHKYILESSAGVFDMAKIARNMKMGYDDNGQLSFKVGKKTIFFYDDELLNQSSRKDHSTITSFLTSGRKNSFFESTCEKFYLEINDKKEVLLIDKDQVELTGKIKLFDSPEEALSESKSATNLPKNFGKYSVPHAIAHRDARKIISHSLSKNEISIPNIEEYILKDTPKLSHYLEFLKKENMFQLLQTNPSKAHKILSKSDISSRKESLIKLEKNIANSTLISNKDVINDKLFLNYDFTDSKENNINSFLKNNEDLNISESELGDLCDLFISSNYDIFAKNRTTIKVKKVINNLPNKFPPPDLAWLDSKSFKDMKVLDDLAKKTSLKKSEIKTILHDIIEYKKYHGLDETVSEEYHRNTSAKGDSTIEVAVFFENLIKLKEARPLDFAKVLTDGVSSGAIITSPDAEQAHDSAGHIMAGGFTRGHKGVTVKKQKATTSTSILRFNDLNIFSKDDRIKLSNIPSAINKSELEKIAKFQSHHSYLIKNINSLKNEDTKELLLSVMDDGGFNALYESNDSFLNNQGISMSCDSSKTDIKAASKEILSILLEDKEVSFKNENMVLTNEDQLDLFNYASYCNRVLGSFNDDLVESIGCYLDDLSSNPDKPFDKDSKILKSTARSMNDDTIIEKVIDFRNKYQHEALLHTHANTVVVKPKVAKA
jgi:hypothetical protein